MALLPGVLAKPQASAYTLCCSQSIPRRPGGGDREEMLKNIRGNSRRLDPAFAYAETLSS